MLNVRVPYPTADEELEILRQTTGDAGAEPAGDALGRADRGACSTWSGGCPWPSTCSSTRATSSARAGPNEPEATPLVKKCVSWGAGPRAGQSLILAAKARAVLHGRFARRRSPTSATSPGPVLRHRIVTTFHAEAEGIDPDKVIAHLLEAIAPPPRAGRRAAGRGVALRRSATFGDRAGLDPWPTPTHATRPPLDPTALARFGRLELLARLVVEGVMSGLHKSPFKGFSVEFAEHRQYGPGDEIRHIDWRAFGKTDRYFVKEYEEETNLKAYLVVDSSGSMGYAGPDGRRSSSTPGGSRRRWPT